MTSYPRQLARALDPAVEAALRHLECAANLDRAPTPAERDEMYAALKAVRGE